MADAAKPQKVLFLSDSHMGAKISMFGAYKDQIIDLMRQYDHVVLIGDCWELFYVSKHHVKDLSGVMESVTGQDAKHWAKKFDKNNATRTGVENVIHGAQWFTEEFLTQNPNVHLHAVGGNHESVRRFHHTMEDLQRDHANFEWSPEAIRLGDALITHGHLPMRNMTVAEYPIARLRDAEKNKRWTNLLDFFGPIEQVVQELKGYKKSSALIESRIREWAGEGRFSVSHNGIVESLDMGWVKHVFFGHTHVKFNNYQPENSELLFHNTGAIVASTAKKPEGLGLLEAEINADGTITDVRPVSLTQDKKPHYLASGAGVAAGR